MKTNKRLVPGLIFILSLSGLGSTSVWALSIEVSQDASREVALTISAISRAQRSVQMNIYEMQSEAVADALESKINEGITVEILEEGQPVGGVSPRAQAIRGRLVSAMNASTASRKDHFYVMTTADRAAAERRFHFDHAKYVVIDGTELLIGSENYSGSLHPESSHPGNRGWEVLVHQSDIARQFADIFSHDVDPSFGDISDISQSKRVFWRADDLLLGLGSGVPKTGKLPVTAENQSFEADSVEKILSPSSLEGLQTTLRASRHKLDLELMTFSSHWGSSGKISPLYSEVVQAARRGVAVRVLLNDESVFSHHPSRRKHQNEITVDALNAVAEEENLPLEAKIADVEAMGVSYIHNKGALIDNEGTLISSINWNQNSVENNREAALVVHSIPVHDYYQSLFDQDWNE